MIRPYVLHHRALRCALAASFTCCALASWAQEIEPNDAFATRTIFPPGPAGPAVVPIAAELTPIPFDPFAGYQFTAALAPGTVNAHDFSGLPAGAAYVAYLDNLPIDPPPDPDPDTMMRSHDEISEIAFDDDDSPLGNGLASGFLSNVNADGSVRLQVTGFPDEFFMGEHAEEGSYDLYLQLGPFGDVDYLTMTGLVPGSPFAAEITVGDPPDTVLAWLDDAGVIIAEDNDNGVGFLSMIEGIVPASGNVHLSVTAFPDFPLVGGHFDGGEYELSFSGVFVPEPSTFVLAGIGLVVALAYGRRRRA